jgi:hypothetical protein
VHVSGTAEDAEIDMDAGAIVFNETAIGARATSGTTVTNHGKGSVRIANIRLADGSKGFRLLGPDVPFTLDPVGGAGSSMAISLDFTPGAPGVFADTVLLSSECCLLFKVPVTGTGSDEVVASVPGGMPGSALSGGVVAPNPARGDEATLSFVMERKGSISAVLVDASGKELRTLADNVTLEQGEQSLKLDLGGLASGSYFVRISAAGRTVIAPLVVAR